MSKRIRPQTPRRLALLLLVSTALVCASGVGAVLAQRTQTATVNPKSAAVVAATAEVLTETSELRKLPVLRQVRSGAQSRADIERMIIKNLDEDSSPEEMRASETALKKFGLAPAEFKLRAFIINLLTEQVAGYYDPKTQEFYLADWIDIDGQKPVMSHELTHALQDQHFNLRRFEKWPKGDSDAELAAQALVEGDATYVMMQYIVRNPLRALAMMKSITANGATTEQIDKAPRALRETLLFPYEGGQTFASQLYRKGGWDLVSKAYKELPQSTEQILHSEKYFARESPVKINFPNIAPALGANWKRTDYDVNGEWSYYLILDEFLKEPKESRRAAAGWGGDRYALYEDARTGGVLLAQLVAWDTEEDAAEFFDAYVRRTTLRYKNLPAESANADPDTYRTWATPEGAVVLERRGAQVAILEGVPQKASSKELLKTLWQENIPSSVPSSKKF
ncbi:MAG TPA: hypothetical protein VNA19_13960 [Pyrinomonadaceae bacterium]|nr:hypothetical protein [Pyrinomonadaceae bacterium]